MSPLCLLPRCLKKDLKESFLFLQGEERNSLPDRIVCFILEIFTSRLYGVVFLTIAYYDLH